ncbi:protein of unknown function [Saccharicrinis carchari]|uniref:Fibronectin type-III domain-containing protein n=1 Tax=Saccharicrinis carchari TaxID=1168039 RepID=A0A521DH99_SACCC|nr:DUF4959 domain-containing protein [Saccharicrinis carchari]SMO71154.1 protein of unknown function [Saccharicrinis carchari]
MKGRAEKVLFCYFKLYGLKYTSRIQQKLLEISRYYPQCSIRKICSGTILLGLILHATSCSKQEDSDTIPPGQVTGVTVQALNSAVLLKWINPSDEDFAFTIISYGAVLYGDTPKEVTYKNEKKVENLINGTQYTFELCAVDYDGNISEPVSVKATPDKYITVIQRKDIKDETFGGLNTMFPIHTVINNINLYANKESLP